jgi:hypothetical protein
VVQGQIMSRPQTGMGRNRDQHTASWFQDALKFPQQFPLVLNVFHYIECRKQVKLTARQRHGSRIRPHQPTQALPTANVQSHRRVIQTQNPASICQRTQQRSRAAAHIRNGHPAAALGKYAVENCQDHLSPTAVPPVVAL